MRPRSKSSLQRATKQLSPLGTLEEKLATKAEFHTRSLASRELFARERGETHTFIVCCEMYNPWDTDEEIEALRVFVGAVAGRVSRHFMDQGLQVTTGDQSLTTTYTGLIAERVAISWSENTEIPASST